MFSKKDKEKEVETLKKFNILQEEIEGYFEFYKKKTIMINSKRIKK